MTVVNAEAYLLHGRIYKTFQSLVYWFNFHVRFRHNLIFSIASAEKFLKTQMDFDLTMLIEVYY